MPNSLTSFLLVMLGGACGAGLRYLFMTSAGHLEARTLWGIMAANLIGCFLAGVLLGSQTRELSPSLYYFLGIGLLGSLTTLSTFSVETLSLFGLPESFDWTRISAWAYFSATTFGGLLACALGMRV